MNNKKETVWVTIPEESVSSAKNGSKKIRRRNSDKVENKTFWGAGFVAVVVFSTMFFFPHEFSSLMKGDLFDGGFQVVPDYSEQEGSSFFDNGEDASDEAASEEVDGSPQNDTVVGSESDAVDIQIEPLSDSEAEVVDELADDEPVLEATTDEASSDSETDDVAEAVELEIEPTEASEVSEAEVPSTLESELASNKALLESLAAQLEEFRQKDAESNKNIADLKQLLEEQAAASLHGAATTQISPSLVPQGQQTNQVPVNNNSVYRYNTHTVTISPYDVLSQNQGVQQIAAANQANIVYGGTTAYSNQNYNPVLAGVQGQPGTGPAESMMIALLAVSVCVLAWGVLRAARA